VAKLPNKRAVSQALREVRRTLKQAIKQVNVAAADLAKKGNYERVEATMAKGRELITFREEVAEVEKKWKQVCGSGAGGAKASTKASIAEWEYYGPILRSLNTLGGKASLKDIEAEFLQTMSSHLGPGDHTPMAGGHERWQAMIYRSRKHMIKEGWISPRSSKVWELTANGRSVAAKQGDS
jgi:hypothetical protein